MQDEGGGGTFRFITTTTLAPESTQISIQSVAVAVSPVHHEDDGSLPATSCRDLTPVPLKRHEGLVLGLRENLTFMFTCPHISLTVADTYLLERFRWAVSLTFWNCDVAVCLLTLILFKSSYLNGLYLRFEIVFVDLS